MFKKATWLLKCIKRNIRVRQFWSLSDLVRIIYYDFRRPYTTGRTLYELNESRHQMMIDFIKNNYEEYRLTNYEGCKPARTDINDKNIWVLWLQGEASMPDVVKVCYKNLKKNANGHNVILLTNDNLEDYLCISPKIRNKVGKSLSYTAFSDFVRLNLLSFYGGLWVDATFFITHPLDESIFNTDFFSIKNKVNNNAIVCRYKWAVNFMFFPQNSAIVAHVRNIFCAFWDKNDKPINYLFIDYCFEYERLHNNKFDSLIESLPYSNEYSHQIRLNFNDSFNQTKYDSWLKDTSLFKLSYKGDLREVTKEGNLTYYGFIIKQLN